MYSVEITVEKDKVTGETRVLSSTTVLPRELLPQGIAGFIFRTGDHIGGDPLPQVPVGLSADQALVYRRVAGQDVLQLHGADPVAFRFDHPVGPAPEEEKAVLDQNQEEEDDLALLEEDI